MKQYLFAGVLALLFFIVQLFTLSNYGMNWDTPEHLMRGQAYLQLFLTSKKNYIAANTFSPVLIRPGEFISRYSPAAIEISDTFPKLPLRPLVQKDFRNTQKSGISRISFYQSQDWNGTYYVDKEIPGHPPLGDILSAITNKIFYQLLGIMGDIESYQLFYILLSASGIFIVTLFTYEITGSLIGGAVAGIALGMYPLFTADTQINVKDPAVAVLFTGAIWSLWHWVKDDSKKWMIAFFAFTLFALGIKWNIVFLCISATLWIAICAKTPECKKWFHWKLLLYFFLFFLLSICFLVVIYPAMWSNPITSLGELIKFYWGLGVGVSNFQPTGFILPFGINIYPLILFLTQTPELILGLLVAGIFSPIPKGKCRVKTLLLLVLGVTLLRVSIPGVRLYGGLRQIMELVPVVAILSGIGAGTIIQNLESRIKNYAMRMYVLTASFVLILIVLTIPIIRLFPNENMYFNLLVGGASGAYKANLTDWLTNYGNAYKQAADWLDIHAQKNANIAFLDGPMFALSPLWLRNDISISPNHFSGFDQKGEYILQLTNPIGANSFPYRYSKNFLIPIHVITAEGVPIITIYKNSPNFSNIKFAEKSTTSFVGRPGESANGIYWEVDLGQVVQVTRILLTNIPPICQKTNAPYVDEFVQFLTSQDEVFNPLLVYDVQEHNKLTFTNVEYFYAGEEARFIRIYPKSGFSCFNNATIQSIRYLSR